jgi:acyl-coenzyme A synthetase/AMP-(fatty) acid ligase
MIPQTAFAMLACARIGDSVVLEVLHHMNWPSELMIANQSNHNRIIRRLID